VPQEVNDLGNELELLYQAIKGMQASADDSETEPEHFEPTLLFMQKIQGRVKRIGGALDRLNSLPRLDQKKTAEVQPARAPSNGKGRQAASPRKASMRAGVA
jgi:hypothetical protein